MADKILTIDQLLKELDKYKFKQLHIHHTWKPTHKDFNGSNHRALQQSMRNYHVQSRGWKDIGHHLALMPDGLFVTGRPFNKTPASIKGWNTRALALEMVGNFDKPGTGANNTSGYDVLEGKQKEGVLALIRYFGDRFGYDKIVFHREGPGVGKTCPGTSLDKATLIAEAKGHGDVKPIPAPKPQVSAKLKVDGYWGIETTKALQRYFKTPADGYLSGQKDNRWTRALSKGTVKHGSGGSLVIKAIQRLVGAKVDGLLGPETVRKIQMYLGTPVDGEISKPSMMVKEMQRRLNKGKF